MSKIKISHTSSQMYLECGRKYDLHYNKKLRSKYTKSPLVFGSAIDQALNELLLTRDVDKAKTLFIAKMTHIVVNGINYNLEETPDIVRWSKNDVEPVLSEDPRLSLIRKGELAIEAYNAKIMPRIKKVIAVQKDVLIENKEGDQLKGALDLVVEWEDGRILLLDNKTTSVPYKEDSASQSPQLNLYYWAEKSKYKFDAIGFIVMSKKILLNECKICKSCGHIGSGKRHKFCDNKVEGKRCNGDWEVTYSPECEIDVIINNVDEKVLDKTFENLDAVNEGLTNGIFEPNKKSCFNYGKCVYYDLCHKNSMGSIVDLSEKDK